MWLWFALIVDTSLQNNFEIGIEILLILNQNILVFRERGWEEIFPAGFQKFKAIWLPPEYIIVTSAIKFSDGLN